MKNPVNTSSESISESKFPHVINSEKRWRQILGNNKYALDVLDTIMQRQHGQASDRQMAILRKVQNGDTTPYHSKN